jgi:hypothetical protein
MGHITADCPDKNQETGLMVGFYTKVIEPDETLAKEMTKNEVEAE